MICALFPTMPGDGSARATVANGLLELARVARPVAQPSPEARPVRDRRTTIKRVRGPAQGSRHQGWARRLWFIRRDVSFASFSRLI
eukprot:81808-Chlamydomonas_euryale.AAC.1